MDVELLHDLRLSLQLIQASAQMLQFNGNGGEARGYLDALMEGAAQMGRLLDGALKRREARETGPVELMGCLWALCLRCRDYAAARGVDVTLSGNVDALTLAWEGGSTAMQAGESFFLPKAGPELTLKGSGRAALSMPK